MNRKLRQLNRNVGRTLAFGGGAAVGNKLAKEQSKSKFKPSGSSLRKNSRLPKITRYHLTRLRKIQSQKIRNSPE